MNESERIIGMEAYKEGLLRWLEEAIRKEIVSKRSSDMTDVHIGAMNAYSFFFDHIKGTKRDKRKKHL